MPDISVLIIDDDLSILKAISAVLKHEHIAVTCADHALLAAELLKTNSFDLILLDIVMPDQDGFSLLKEIRNQKNYTPVILLSGRDDDSAQVQGLEIGADDYITKPFSKAILVSKIRALVRRTNQYTSPQEDFSGFIQKGPFSLQMNTLTIKKNGREITLTAREFSLFYLFLESPGVTFSKQEILDKVWQGETSDDSIILVYIKKLRDKIEDDPAHPTHIRTVWGKGYEFYL